MARVVHHPLTWDWTPIRLARRLAERRRFVFLDSAQSGDSLGRFSVLAWEPEIVFQAFENASHVTRHDVTETSGQPPLKLLDRLLDEFDYDAEPGMKFPYGPGAYGVLSYDLGRTIERVPATAADDLGAPLIDLGFYSRVLVFDAMKHHWWLAARLEDGDSGEGIADFVRDVEQLMAEPRESRPATAPPAVLAKCNMDRAAYTDAVRRALAHIRDGDIYQVNLARRFAADWHDTPFALYERLRDATPARFAAYLHLDDYHVLSASPESFLRRRDLLVSTRPIKGTRPRTGDLQTDERARGDLTTNPKDRAELSMIVDLERNDLGRVCEYGTVQVVEHAVVDALPTVFHTYSTIEGQLREGTTHGDLLRATFPGGSITGAPKIRSMQIVEELEGLRRGPYTGSVGYLGAGGMLELNIAIRTMVLKDERAYFHAGAGIVADSDPDAEFDETHHKAVALLRALNATASEDAS
ncbi:MAG: aminodeoxychorismate synthase component I [Deltaproteobacteria bacterium]|nr:aminodeoxychorismate synthase component I [Deltaproteobacteria bacterium]